MEALTSTAKATILLCTNLGLRDSSLKPYTAVKWFELGKRIVASKIKTPAGLFGLSEAELVQELGIDQEEAGHITGLLGRGADLAFCLTELEQRGIHLVTKSDAAYPQRISRILGHKNAPPVLYYCGSLELAGRRGIGVVGSRNIDREGIRYTEELVGCAVQQGMIIYSGGARGVDSNSRLRALACGGSCVEFLADSMLRRIKERDTIRAITEGRLLLLSAVSPEAGFNVGNAMGRNKYIYALSEATFVIASEKGKGGTWTGAAEAMSHGWGQVAVWQNSRYSGNIALLELGAAPIGAPGMIDFSQPLAVKREAAPKQVEMDLFAVPSAEEVAEQPGEPEQQAAVAAAEPVHAGTGENEPVKVAEVLTASPPAAGTEPTLIREDNPAVDPAKEAAGEIPAEALIYHAVLPVLLRQLQEPCRADALAERLGLVKKQLDVWLALAVQAKLVKRVTGPVRYVAIK